jgi:hypothetical protein
MTRIYSHQDIGMVQLAKNELDAAGIDSDIRGEHLSAIAGGGAELTAWVQLWTVEEERLEEAMAIIAEFIAASLAEGDSGESWTCPDCAETVDAPLAVCWNCGREQPELVA